MMPCITPAQLLDNITIEDVARLFTGDGITIPQISDVFEWGLRALVLGQHHCISQNRCHVGSTRSQGQVYDGVIMIRYNQEW